MVFTSDNGRAASTEAATRPCGAQGHHLGGRHAGAVHRALAGGDAGGATSDDWPRCRPLPDARPGRGPLGRSARPDRGRRRRSPVAGGAPGAASPTGAVDGRDLGPLRATPDAAPSPHEPFAYYWMDDLEAVRRRPVEAPRGPSTAGRTRRSTTSRRPRRVRRPPRRRARRRRRAVGDRRRAPRRLGDAVRRASTGSGRRAAGRVGEPRPLTTYDPAHPYLPPSTTSPTGADPPPRRTGDRSPRQTGRVSRR